MRLISALAHNSVMEICSKGCSGSMDMSVFFRFLFVFVMRLSSMAYISPKLYK